MSWIGWSATTVFFVLSVWWCVAQLRDLASVRREMDAEVAQLGRRVNQIAEYLEHNPPRGSTKE